MKQKAIEKLKQRIKEQKLKQENKALKKALAICINKPLIKRLVEAEKRIAKGQYISENEFFRGSHS